MKHLCSRKSRITCEGLCLRDVVSLWDSTDFTTATRTFSYQGACLNVVTHLPRRMKHRDRCSEPFSARYNIKNDFRILRHGTSSNAITNKSKRIAWDTFVDWNFIGLPTNQSTHLRNLLFSWRKVLVRIGIFTRLDRQKWTWEKKDMYWLSEKREKKKLDSGVCSIDGLLRYS